MPDHSSDAAPAATRAQLRAARQPGDTADTIEEPTPIDGGDDWRRDGESVTRWREWLLAAALVSLGIAILAGTLLTAIWQSPWAAASATAILWLGMLLPVVWALSLARPAGLLRFRALDLLYGIVLGGMLRLTQGWIAQASGGTAAFPSYPLVDGRLGEFWWLTDGVAAVVVAPVIEEFFFRGVILVSIFVILRGPVGRVAAGIAAVVVSTIVFVVVHGVTLGVSAEDLIATTLLGLVCGTLVMLTGRIWGAILVHVIFNATFVALALAGTLLV